MEAGARDSVMAKLNAGEIHAARLAPTKLGETGGNAHIYLNLAYRHGDVFKSGSANLALLLAHEMKHVQFVESFGELFGGIIYGFDLLVNGYNNSVFERVADQHACRVTGNLHASNGVTYGCR
jgi:hypothetical protein